MSRETHSTDQGKMCNYVQGSNGPLDKPQMRRNAAHKQVTRHQSVATPSRRIRHVPEDLRAHQSYQTASRQAMTHIHNMGAHLASYQTKLVLFGHFYRWADQHGRPT